MSPSFTCPHCGKSHEGHPTDYGYSLPDVVWAIPEAERSKQAKWTTDLCQFGERYFIRCFLPISFTDRDGHFGWGLWVEVGWPDFERYTKIYEQDTTSEPQVSAKIANQLPGYEPVLGLPALINFGTSTQRPIIKFPSSAINQLANEQKNGISSFQYHKILESIGAI